MPGPQLDYPTARRYARQWAQQYLIGRFPALTLKGIGQAEIDWFHQNWLRWKRLEDWAWGDIAQKRRNQLSRFELAIWNGGRLCGLAIGKTRQEVCRLDLMEGDPDPEHPLKGEITEITLTALEYYVIFTGRVWALVDSPIEELLPRYRNFGYTCSKEHGQIANCWKEVS